MKLNSIIKYGLLAFICIAICGCRESPVARNMSQKEAVEIAALLNHHGISARIERADGNKDHYEVQVDRSNLASAIGIMRDQGYPKLPEPSFSELIASRGLLPNSRELETLRLERALSLEIEELVRAYPGVVNARAVVRGATEGAMGSPLTQVALVIQERSPKAIDANKMSEIVERVVPGARRESISVSVQRAAGNTIVSDGEGVYFDEGRIVRVTLEPFLLWWRVPSKQYAGLSLALLVCIIVVFAVGGVLGYWYGYYQQSRSFFDADLPEIGPSKTPRVDRPKRDLLTGS